MEEETEAVKKCILSLLLVLALSTGAFAMEIPTDTVVSAPVIKCKKTPRKKCN